MTSKPGCVITDTAISISNTGASFPTAGARVSAFASVSDLFVQQVDGSWLSLSDSTIYCRTDVNGLWNLTLPSQTNSDPNTVLWTIVLPDGSRWTGPVTDAMVTASAAKALTVHDLKNLYGWGATQVTATPITVVQGPQGIQGLPGTAQTAAANTVIAGPTSGAAAPAAPRALIPADIPAIQPSQVAGTAVITTDSRLSDQRTPIDGSVTDAKIVGMSSSKLLDIIPTALVPIATALVLGGIKVGSGIQVAVDGTISILTATFAALGLVRQTVYNVRDYGAFGDGNYDGSGHTDTTAIQAASDAAAANPRGGIVKFPAGSYMFDATLSRNGSNVVWEGDGDATILVAQPNTVFSTAGLITCADTVRQRGNHIRKMMIDANGQNGTSVTYDPTSGVIQGLVSLPSFSTFEATLINRCPLTNAGVITPGMVGVLATGSHSKLENATVRDDPYTSSIVSLINGGTGSVAAGNVSLTLPSASAFHPVQPITFDPEVDAYGDLTVLAGNSRTVTPLTLFDNPRPNGSVSTGMLGIVTGQKLYVGGFLGSVVMDNQGTNYQGGATVWVDAPTLADGVTPTPGGRTATAHPIVNAAGNIAGMWVQDPGRGYFLTPVIHISGGNSDAAAHAVLQSVCEQVTVSSPTATTFNATFSHAHGANEPIWYISASTEVAIVTSVAGSVVTCSTQVSHAAGIAVITQPPLWDGAAVDGQGLGQRRPRGFTVRDSLGLGLSLDAWGAAVADKVSFVHNRILRCNSGMTATNVNHLRVVDNDVDLTFAGFMPFSAQWSGFFSLGIGGNISLFGHGIKRNHFKGATFAVYEYSPATMTQLAVDIDDNYCENQGLHAVVATCVKGMGLKKNRFYNWNTQARTSSPVIGVNTPMSAVLLFGEVSSQTVSIVNLDGNDFVDDRSSPQTQGAIYGHGPFVTSVLADTNYLYGVIGPAVATGAGAVIQERNTKAYNGVVPTPAFPAVNDGVAVNWVRNVTGQDAIIALSAGGATLSHVYVNTANTTAGATDLLVSGVFPPDIFVPNNTWVGLVFNNVGTPTWLWSIAASRFVSFTLSGPPAGTLAPYQTGDEAIDTAGHVWLCIASGAPGTWVCKTPRPLSPLPQDQKLKGWSLDPAGHSTTFQLVANGMRVTRVPVMPGDVINFAELTVVTTGTAPTGFYLGLYANSGITAGLVAQSIDISGSLAAGPVKGVFTAAYTVPAGVYWLYVAVLCVGGTTLPTISVATSANANAGLTQNTDPGRTLAVTATGSLPASFNSTTSTFAGSTPFVQVA